MPKEPNRAETSAARHVARLVGGRAEIHDDGSANGMYDFKVVVGAEVHALEVTSMTVDAQKQLTTEARKHVQMEGLANAWHVKPTRRASRRLKKSLPGIREVLEWLESEDLHSLPRRTQDLDLSDRLDWANSRGLEGASVLESWKPGEIRIDTDQAGSVHAYPDEAIAEIVQCVAMKQDNRTKLERSALARRHLFVEIDPTWLDGLGALNTNPFLPPSLPPALPEEITDLWLRSFDRCWWWDGARWSDT